MTTQKVKFERYIILKDNHFFAGFSEGEESRFGELMSYQVFLREFNACVACWERKGIKPERFTYHIVLVYQHR